MRLPKSLTAGVLALGVLLGGAYAVAQSAAEAAVAEAIARLRAALGPDAVVEHGSIRAEPIAGRVRISSLAITPDRNVPQSILVADVVADGLLPGGTGFRRLSLHGSRILVAGEERGRIGTMTMEGLALPAGAAVSPFDIAFDALDVLDIAWDLPDGSALHVGYIGASGVGGDREDAFEIANLVMVGGRDAGFERLELASFNMRGVRLLPSVQAVLDGRAPPTPRGASLLTFSGLLVQADGVEWMRVAEFNLNADDAEGHPPGTQRSNLTITGLVMGLPEEARTALNGLEAIRLSASGAALSNLDRGDIEVEQFRLEAEELGEMDLALRLTGVVPTPVGDPMANASLHGFRLSFQDWGLTARAIAGVARLGGVTEAAVREQARQALGEWEGMLAAVPPAPARPGPKGAAEPPLPASKLGPQAGATPPGGRSLRAFLERPGRITISAQPAQPVPLAQIGGMFGADPREILSRLGLRVEVQ